MSTGYLFLLFIAPFTGGLLGYFITHNNTSLIKLVLAFSGSYLLALTVLNLIPEVFHNGGNYTGAFVLAGFLLQIFLDFFTKGADHGHIHHEGEHDFHKRIPISFIISLSLHSFIEGTPLGSETIDIGFRQRLIYGIALHELPAAFVLVSVLRANLLHRPTILPVLVLYSLMSVTGLLLSRYLTTSNFMTEAVLNNLLAVVIGTFLHISTTILFESSENHRFNRYKLAAITLGIFIAFLNLLIH